MHSGPHTAIQTRVVENEFVVRWGLCGWEELGLVFYHDASSNGGKMPTGSHTLKHTHTHTKNTLNSCVSHLDLD